MSFHLLDIIHLQKDKTTGRPLTLRAAVTKQKSMAV